MTFSKHKLKTWASLGVSATVLIVLIIAFFRWWAAPPLSPAPNLEITEYVRTLDKYAFDRLRLKAPDYSPIELHSVLKRDPAFVSYLFTFQSDGATVSGQLNLPAGRGTRPVIVMLRGYVDKEIYYTGLGTRRASEELARAGYITIAPDFLGYGDSGPESFDIWEARFEKPRTILNLIAALDTIPRANSDSIGLWGHSNGGQIALSVLEITQQYYPTVLWAPVTQGFPDSVMEYVDELPDGGAYIKKQFDAFTQRYGTEDYSISNHWEKISAPIQVHQGGSDELVDMEQTELAVKTLEGVGKTVRLFKYPAEDHNFNQGSFPTMMQRDIGFYSLYLE